MSMLPWVFFPILIIYFSSKIKIIIFGKYFKYGPFTYTFEDTPIFFIFIGFLNLVCKIFVLTMFGLMVVSRVWGPVFHS